MNSVAALPPSKNLLFGRPLSDVCEKDGSPPKPIMVRLQFTKLGNLKFYLVNVRKKILSI